MQESYYIDLDYATFAIDVKDSIVVEAPPIAKWIIGKSYAEVSRWVDRKHGIIKLL